MREIITIQIGQCGNNIGMKFWEIITDEHGITFDGNFEGDSDLQLQYLNIFFNEVGDGKYIPRSLNIDLDPVSLDILKSESIARIFSSSSFISGHAGASNNWAKGHYTEGAELAHEALERIRVEAENCDLIQGFQVIHSLGGGTGSGMGSLLINLLREDYPERIIESYSIIPSIILSQTVVEPYNSILSLNQLISSTNGTFCIENQALHNIIMNYLGIGSPSYSDMNYLISNCISGITTSLRFPGQLNMDLRKLLVNMVPFPKLHFFVPSFAPLMGRRASAYRMDSVKELTQDIFEERNIFAVCDPRRGRFLTLGVIFRGIISPLEVEQRMLNIRNNNSLYFMDWLPNSISVAMCNIPPRGLKMSATLISNTTAIHELFKRMLHSFSAMLRKRAYLHWYTEEGIYESEFSDAEMNIQQLIDDYQQYQEIGAGTDDIEVDNINEK